MTGNFILSESMLPEDIYNLFINYYDHKSLISIQQALPNLQDVQNTSNVIIGGFEVDKEINRLTFCCALDNLLKGAACLLYTSPSPRDQRGSRMPSSA